MIPAERDRDIDDDWPPAGCRPVEGVDAVLHRRDARIIKSLQHQENLNGLVPLAVEREKAAGQTNQLSRIMKTYDDVDGGVGLCMGLDDVSRDRPGTLPALRRIAQRAAEIGDAPVLYRRDDRRQRIKLTAHGDEVGLD